MISHELEKGVNYREESGGYYRELYKWIRDIFGTITHVCMIVGVFS